MHMGDISAMGRFYDGHRGPRFARAIEKRRGIRFLTESVTSPSLAAMMQCILADMPEAKWHQYEPARGNGQFYGA